MNNWQNIMVGGHQASNRYLSHSNGVIVALKVIGVNLLPGQNLTITSGATSASWITPLKLAPCRGPVGWTLMSLELSYLDYHSSQRSYLA
jgi:hypothetical protein